MATDKKAFTMRMAQENFDKIKHVAAENKRSIAMQVELLIEDCVKDFEAEHGIISLSPD